MLEYLNIDSLPLQIKVKTKIFFLVYHTTTRHTMCGAWTSNNICMIHFDIQGGFFPSLLNKSVLAVFKTEMDLVKILSKNSAIYLKMVKSTLYLIYIYITRLIFMYYSRN